MKTSEEERKRESDRYYWLKEHGICVKCGHEDARPGRTRCEACAEKAWSALSYYRSKRAYDSKLAKDRQYYETHRKEITEKRRRQREERATQGLCPRCGKKLTDSRYKYCLECRLYGRRIKREKHQPKMWRELGFCIWCGSPEVVQDRKLCAACLEKARQSAANARSYIDMAGHPWQKLNHALFQKKDMEHEEDEETGA